MAALNLSTFHGQLFWLITSFSVFYIIFVVIIVPNIYMIFKVRNLLIKKLAQSGDRSVANTEINFINKASIVEYLRYFLSTKVISNLSYINSYYNFDTKEYDKDITVLPIRKTKRTNYKKVGKNNIKKLMKIQKQENKTMLFNIGFNK